MVPPLIDDYKVVIPDLPGHWKSDPRKGPIGVDQLLSGVEVVMDSVCAGEEVVLVGNSLGAWLAMLYAHDYPANVARMVLINGGAITNVNPAIKLFPETREEARETMKALMGPATLPLPDFVLDDVIRHARVGPAGRFVQTLGRVGPLHPRRPSRRGRGAGRSRVGRRRRSVDPRRCTAIARRVAASAAAHGPRLWSRAAPRVPGQDSRSRSRPRWRCRRQELMAEERPMRSRRAES